MRAALPAFAWRIQKDEPLARHCTWGLGGLAEVYIEVETVEELKAVQQYCRQEKIPVLLLGWGSNILFPDEGVKGCILRLCGDFEAIEFRGTEVRAGAGVHLPRLAIKCAEKGLAGVESLAGVPGTVGGALVMNAGTPRGAIGDVVKSVDVLYRDGSLITLTRDKVQFGYRHSSLAGQVIVSAVLSLKPADEKEIKKRIKEELDHRQKTQPLGTKNAGSVFQNPPNDHAGRMIEAAGLKGFALGRVRVSPKHANFIENTGGATAKEMLSLIHHIQEAVKEKFGVELELEVKLVKQAEVLP
ncbi:MAG: UDP-N-acetylmuramate dehydrogenase [Elusimicrobia bacterium]|nr:UDP-N-acetylmuramate dehydrogenase [Candidatus Obscuribacterium magneticum]